MNISKHFAFSALAAAMLFASCKNNSPYEGYDASDNGLYYKFYTEQNEDGQKPMVGEHVMISFKIKTTEKDSLLGESKNMQTGQPGPIEMPVEKPTFVGGFEEGLMMMSPGDSASFIISADSFMLKTNRMEKLPPFIKPGSMLTLDVKLISIKDSLTVKKEREKMMADREVQMKEMEKQMEERKGSETTEIEAYLKTSKITVKPTQSGLYYVERKKGTGTRVKMGDNVKVNYSLFFLDGTMLESNTAVFPMDVQGMIPGFVEGVTMMNQGGKATLLLPSSIGYGPYGNQAIPPYTPLVFEVEVVEVNPQQ
jgi:FKBP-type peptidyl-prolyl cis-trans isomerase